MPKVLKNIPKQEKQIVCDHCGNTIAYVKNDIKSYTCNDYGGGSNTDEYRPSGRRK